MLVLTTFDLDEYVFGALQAGASGFLLKDVPRDELVRAVRVVAAGDALLAPAATRRLIAAYVGAVTATGTPTPPVLDREDRIALERLTAREREVLVLLAGGRSNAEIAAELFVGEATVKTHVAHVLMKLGVRDRVQAVIRAFELGLAPLSR